MVCWNKATTRAMKKVFVDLLVIAVSIALAIYIVQTGVIHALLDRAGDGIVIGSFVAGAFFTSLFTAAPATVVLGELAQEGNIFLVAVVGGFGAVLGDYLLFLFVRDRVARDTAAVMHGPRLRKVLRILKRSHYRRLLPIIGALIIASPFPDELGLALLGFSSMHTRSFFLLSFCMNAAGILVIGLVARSL